MLPLTVKSKAAAFQAMMTAGAQLRNRGREDFCDNSYPSPNSVTPTPSKSLPELLKSVIRMLGCPSSQLMASGEGAGGGGLSSSQRAGL